MVREKREEQTEEEQRRADKTRKEMKRHQACFAKDVRGGTYTHVGKTIDSETGTRALEKLSRTPSYICVHKYICVYIYTCICP